MTTRSAFAEFIRKFAAGECSDDQWQRFAVAHYADELMESVRIRLVRASIADGATDTGLLMELSRELETSSLMQLPHDYLLYLRGEPPMFGDVGCDDFDRYFELWPEDDVHQFNIEYEVPVLAAGFVAFATNGGGELYAFDQSGRVFELPCIGMAPQYASEIATSWGEFEARIKKTGEQAGTSNGG
jgi:hypothetical protein